MTTPTTPSTVARETALDDVRRVREALHRASGGSIRARVDESNRLLEPTADELGLRIVPPAPPLHRGRDGTHG